jgi:hypothetical protein
MGETQGTPEGTYTDEGRDMGEGSALDRHRTNGTARGQTQPQLEAQKKHQNARCEVAPEQATSARTRDEETPVVQYLLLRCR